MKLAAVNLEDFEGLVFRTTVRLMPFVEVMETDFSEVQQLLRIKVWKAYESYDPSRSKLPLKQYVFGCLVNYTKDLKKQAARVRKNGSVVFIEDFKRRDVESNDHFDGRYLAIDADAAYVSVEDEAPMLPNTLTTLELRVIGFLMLDYSMTEIQTSLEIGPKRLRAVRDEIQAKMADWRPTAQRVPERVLEAA